MIVAGFGFRGNATVGSLRDALAATSSTEIEAIAAPDDKAQSPCFQDFARETALPILSVAPDALVTTQTATQSAHSLTNRGTGSVAEACALAAAGPQAELLTTRQISPDKMATCAIAKGPRV